MSKGVGVRVPSSAQYMVVVQLIRTSALGAEGRRFESCLPYQNEVVAQVVEYHIVAVRAMGSNPSNLTKNKKIQIYLVIKNNLLIFALENNTGVWRSGSAADCTQSNSLKRIGLYD